jgi:hypothetical protein
VGTMRQLQAVLESPHLIDFILGITVLEGIVLVRWGRRLAAEVVWMLLPGICLLLAVRAALAGATLPWLPASLATALITHLADLRMRWRI